MRTDVIVLGAGMVGVSAALHLQAHGRSVVLVDRRPAAEETSFGNAGLIQCEGIVPYAFPHQWRKILHAALNRGPESNLHWRALPWLAPFLYRYWLFRQLYWRPSPPQTQPAPPAETQPTDLPAESILDLLDDNEPLPMVGMPGRIASRPSTTDSMVCSSVPNT